MKTISSYLKALDNIISKRNGMKINWIHHFMTVTKINRITDEELDESAKSPRVSNLMNCFLFNSSLYQFIS